MQHTTFEPSSERAAKERREVDLGNWVETNWAGDTWHNEGVQALLPPGHLSLLLVPLRLGGGEWGGIETNSDRSDGPTLKHKKGRGMHGAATHTSKHSRVRSSLAFTRKFLRKDQPLPSRCAIECSHVTSHTPGPENTATPPQSPSQPLLDKPKGLPAHPTHPAHPAHPTLGPSPHA